MTLFGKILVFLNLVVSVLMATWALGIYTQRIDWNGKGGPDKPPGEVPKRQERIIQLWRSLQTAETRWKTAWQAAWVPQQQRGPLLKWYEAQLKTLDTGDAVIKLPVYKDAEGKLKTLDTGGPPAGGRLVLVPDKTTGLIVPVMEESKERSFRSLEVYLRELQTTEKAIEVEVAKSKQAILEDTDLTIKLAGDLQAGGKIKGLRQRLAEEKMKQERVRAEQEMLKPLLVNSEVESELLLDRSVQLKKRIKELEALEATAAR
jgi:hypothetical protein